jgi:hypothetical protein
LSTPIALGTHSRPPLTFDLCNPLHQFLIGFFCHFRYQPLSNLHLELFCFRVERHTREVKLLFGPRAYRG